MRIELLFHEIIVYNRLADSKLQAELMGVGVPKLIAVGVHYWVEWCLRRRSEKQCDELRGEVRVWEKGHESERKTAGGCGYTLEFEGITCRCCNTWRP